MDGLHYNDILMPISEVFNNDCMFGMKGYPDGHFDLAICDIPYGIGVGKMAFLREIGTTVKQKNGTRLNPNKKKRPYKSKSWDNEVPGQEYFDEIRRVSKHQIIFGVDYVSWEGLGNGRIKWNKGVNEGVSFKKYETAYCSLIEEEVELPLLWAGMCQAKSLSEPMTQQGNKKLNEKRIHPCHKPILLYKQLLLTYASPGNRILDTHLGGGGSIRIACHDMGFDFVGYETDIDHYLDQENRWKQYLSQMRLDF